MIVAPKLEDIQQGMACRTIQQALDAPTVAMAKKVVGEEPMIVMLTAVIVKAMTSYFTADQRLSMDMCGAFAEAVVDDFQHESVGDIAVFIKRASRARYGEVRANGEVVGRGQTYGQLTLTRLMAWWQQYLDEKAQALEAIHRKESSQLAPKDGSLHPSVVAIMKEVKAKKVKNEDLDIGRRVNLLVRTVKHMGTERLRHAFNKATTKREKRVILDEAHDRGLVQQYLETHLAAQEDNAEPSGPQQ